MKVDDTGRKVKSIWWNGANGDKKIFAHDEEFIYHSEYYGDHTENWIVVYKDGKEIARHNAAYIATIEWEDE